MDRPIGAQQNLIRGRTIALREDNRVTRALDDDLSNEFHTMCGTIVDAAGVPYIEFRRSLMPRYSLVWAGLLAGYVAIAVIAAMLLVIELDAPALRIPAITVATLLTGHTTHYLGLYMHEASHYNLASKRVISRLVDSSIAQRRSL